MKLAVGKDFCANGIIGINDKLEIYAGYDFEVEVEPEEWEDDLTPVERAERTWPLADRLALADMMLDRWRRFRERATATAA